MASPRSEKSADRPLAYLKHEGRIVYLGRWDTRALVELARQRAALHLGIDRAISARARELGAASPEALVREAALAYRERMNTSRYFGVSWDERRQRWFAQVFHDGIAEKIGHFEGELAAARAHDRVARHHHLPDHKLNFPNHELVSASTEEIKERLRAVAKKDDTSRYIGVVKKEENGARPWYFYLKAGDEHTSVGGYATERQAAVARDRAALFYPSDRALILNFPELAREAGPADFATLRAAIHDVRKASTSSRYRGVSFHGARARWRANINAYGKTESLGYYDDEEDAAVAFDRASLFLLGASAPRNFPERTLKPASPSDLRDAVSRYGRATSKPKRARSRHTSC